MTDFRIDLYFAEVEEDAAVAVHAVAGMSQDWTSHYTEADRAATVSILANFPDIRSAIAFSCSHHLVTSDGFEGGRLVKVTVTEVVETAQSVAAA